MEMRTTGWRYDDTLVLSNGLTLVSNNSQVNTSKTGQGLIQLTVVNDTDSDRSTSNSTVGIPDFLNPSGIFDGLEDTFNNVFDNLTDGINQGVMDLQGELLGSLTKTLGIKDVYVLYLSKICEGKFRNSDDPDSSFEITGCSKYSDSGQGKGTKHQFLSRFSHVFSPHEYH